MLAYVSVGTNDLERAKAFYSELLKPLGANPVMATDRSVAFGTSFNEPLLLVMRPFNGNPATVGNGTMVALRAGKPDVVDALHAAALAAGGECEGKPGPRGEQWYMAYARDLDGNKLAFFATQG